MTQAAVLHLASDDPDRVLGAIASAKGVLEHLGDTQLEIVIQGGAVVGASSGFAKAEQVREALHAHPQITLHLCSLASGGHGMGEGDLVPGAFLTPTATSHCARRQWEGWAYVRLS